MTYVIANWPELFETAETRKLTQLRWCPSPNKLDGLGFRRMAAQRDRCELFAAWNIIRAIASKTMPKERRGWLERDGRALTPEDMAIISGFPETIFTRALSFFSTPDVGWLERDTSATPASLGPVPEYPPGSSAVAASPPARSAGRTGNDPARTGLNPAEGIEGIEEKVGNRKILASTQLRWSEAAGWSGAEFFWEEWKQAYPACDIQRQLLAMTQWLRANPAKAHKSNWFKFATGWLAREQQRGGDIKSVPANGANGHRHLSFAEREKVIGKIRAERNQMFKSLTDSQTGEERTFTDSEKERYEKLTSELSRLEAV